MTIKEKAKAFLKNSTRTNFVFALLSFFVLVLYKVCLCNKAKGPLKIFLLLNSLSISDFAIISPRYTHQSGKLPVISAFLLRISQKFINIIVAKTLLYGELPKLRDFTYFILLIAHFLVFACYHYGLELKVKE